MGTSLKRLIGVWLILLSALGAGLACAQAHKRPPDKPLAELVRESRAGDVIRLAPGRYEASDVKLPHDLTLVGEGDEVILFSPVPVEKGLLVTRPGVSLTVRGLIFEGAHSPSLNGAGIRHQGADLTVERSVFRDNENGILATGAKDGEMIIRQSAFLRNGHGDGYSHGIYQFGGQRFELADSYFVGTRIGHHVKTLARSIKITRNRFDDGDGETSYVIDITQGGDGVITDNDIIRRKSARQGNLVNYSTKRGGEVGTVSIKGNRMTTERRITMLRNPEGAPATLKDNSQQRLRTAPPPMDWRPFLNPIGAVQPATRPETDMNFRLRRLTRDGGPATYGVVFAPGAVREWESVEATVSDRPLPTQLDVKARHPDGSVRHAVLTVEVPAGRGDVRGAYIPVAEEKAAQGWNHGAFAGVTLHLTALSGEVGGPHLIEVVQALSEGEDWLTGPLVQERMVRVEVGPLLAVRFDGRQYHDGTARLRLTFENHKTFSPLPRDIGYRVELRRGQDILLAEDVPLHHAMAGWTTVIPLGHVPNAEAAPNLNRLVDSGALPPLQGKSGLDSRYPPPPAEPVRFGQYAPVVKSMPTTGTRDDIGVITNWTAIWAARGWPEDRARVLRAADVGLTVPWHVEEDNTGLPVRVDQRPDFWTDIRGAKYGDNRLPKILFEGSAGGWKVDLAHKPSLAFPAYLMTGEAVYARALAHEAAYAVSGVWPHKRGEDGMLVTNNLQLRAVAWSLRSIGNAAFLLPDDDPLKDYFLALRDRNLADLYARYVQGGQHDDAGALEGYFAFYGRSGEFILAPWQQDFMALSVAQEVVRGAPKAREVLDWIAGFTTGRVLYIDDPTVYGSSTFYVGAPNGRPAKSWAVAAEMTQQELPDRRVYQNNAAMSFSSLRGALGAIIHATGDQRAVEALAKVNRETDDSYLYADRNKQGRRWNLNYSFDPEQ